MAKKDKEQVGYGPAQCCFNCAWFARPSAPGAVLGHCMRVEGKIHPANTCRLFSWLLEEDDDGDGRPQAHDEVRINAFA